VSCQFIPPPRHVLACCGGCLTAAHRFAAASSIALPTPPCTDPVHWATSSWVGAAWLHTRRVPFWPASLASQLHIADAWLCWAPKRPAPQAYWRSCTSATPSARRRCPATRWRRRRSRTTTPKSASMRQSPSTSVRRRRYRRARASLLANMFRSKCRHAVVLAERSGLGSSADPPASLVRTIQQRADVSCGGQHPGCVFKLVPADILASQLHGVSRQGHCYFGCRVARPFRLVSTPRFGLNSLRARRRCRAGYSVLQGPATSMIRPHPAVWRFIHGVLICYMIFLVFMLFQDVSDARQFLRVRQECACRNTVYV